MTTTVAPLDTDPAAPPRVRRRPAYAVMGAGLIAAGGLTAAFLASAGTSTEPAVVAAHALHRGQTITEADLASAAVEGLPGGSTIPAAEATSLVGSTLTSDIPEGLPIPPAALSDTPVPGPGQTVVGIQFSPGRMPTVELLPGDRVRVVATPRTLDDPPAADPATWRGVVVSTTTDEVAGNTVVNVSLHDDQAAEVAGLAATERVALVLDSQSGGS